MLEKTIIRFLHLKSDWVFKKLEFFSKIEIHSDIAASSKEHFLQYKDEALGMVKARIDHFSKIHGFDSQEIRVKMLKTKWGSCSIKRNLNFNYKVLFLSDNLRDYIIVHELCHLKEMNHSRKFWQHVEKVFPDYRCMREELKKTGL
ncbi:MAG: M48 family metallopeptidase [Parcubacteria group bacterium]|nr:M48 family metallopeptidase [Parcubacteria group bacterium]